MKKRLPQEWIFKVSLLSISLMTMIAPAISSALPLMYGAFKHQSNAAVETLLTVPNFGIIIFLLLSPFIIKIIGEKKTVLLGLSLALVSGILPVFSSTYSVVFVSRFLFGGGVGLFNSMAVSLIPRFYQGNELSTMMGYQSATGSLGSAFMAFLVGYLVTFGWHATFLIYLIALPIMILFATFVSLDQDDQKTSQPTAHTVQKQTINQSIVGLAILIFLTFVFFFALQINLPELITSKKIASLSQVSILSGISTLVSIPVGASFGFISKKLHNNIFPIGFGLIALGFLLVAFSSNLWVISTGIIIAGIGFGISVPFIYVQMARTAPKNSTNLASTILLVATNIGVFLSPTIVNFASSLIGKTNAQTNILFSCIVFVILSIVSLIVVRSRKQAITTGSAH
ncbi:MFS transporter [Oenococcus sicerae]|uniref:MFS transporter n=1 Tax=Oenococcus sicerae TaxID=2203724 RepID=UPI0039E75350